MRNDLLLSAAELDYCSLSLISQSVYSFYLTPNLKGGGIFSLRVSSLPLVTWISFKHEFYLFLEYKCSGFFFLNKAKKILLFCILGNT